ncbi:hypothetical protein TWF569_006461 [Orbilia oligospora]|uniref:Uncharacterized protein n=1 Tax=Orbilia oligospora TaxID=2813651 RepID=A0A7C8NHN0_ORBOL|nr:hypothetical protein TWF706_003114 [Orbilia oligospora]KAF3092081.1 hypothetical protein TWF103_011380 [Orbilia oligospora]KAF3107892.1 hypothetical protein TWF102_011381 [Orbilia oligospora]KAF3118810.1 hypothetical protein TWF703_004280 [Orbilia oligospora]KAF3145911.1 hypothetical protein TWF569_006461 [Orbilia oligospora]
MEPTLETGIPIFSISEKYRKAGIYPQELLASSIKHLHASGVIVLENAIDVEHLDALNAVLAPQAKELANTPGRHFNFGVETGNINQAPLGRRSDVPRHLGESVCDANTRNYAWSGACVAICQW